MDFRSYDTKPGSTGDLESAEVWKQSHQVQQLVNHNRGGETRPLSWNNGMFRILLFAILTICCGCSTTQKRAYEMAVSRTHCKHFATTDFSGIIARDVDEVSRITSDEMRQRLIDSDQADEDSIRFDLAFEREPIRFNIIYHDGTYETYKVTEVHCDGTVTAYSPSGMSHGIDLTLPQVFGIIRI